MSPKLPKLLSYQEKTAICEGAFVGGDVLVCGGHAYELQGEQRSAIDGVVVSATPMADEYEIGSKTAIKTQHQ